MILQGTKNKKKERNIQPVSPTKNGPEELDEFGIKENVGRGIRCFSSFKLRLNRFNKV